MSRLVEIFQVGAFTTRPFGGNPAGVVPDAEGLSRWTRFWRRWAFLRNAWPPGLSRRSHPSETSCFPLRAWRF